MGIQYFVSAKPKAQTKTKGRCEGIDTAEAAHVSGNIACSHSGNFLVVSRKIADASCTSHISGTSAPPGRYEYFNAYVRDTGLTATPRVHLPP